MERRQIWLTSCRQSDAVSWMMACVTCDAQSARQTEEATISKARQEILTACSHLALTIIGIYLTWWHKEGGVTALGSASCNVSKGIRRLTWCNHDKLWFRAGAWTADQSDRLKAFTVWCGCISYHPSRGKQESNYKVHYLMSFVYSSTIYVHFWHRNSQQPAFILRMDPYSPPHSLRQPPLRNDHVLSLRMDWHHIHCDTLLSYAERPDSEFRTK